MTRYRRGRTADAQAVDRIFKSSFCDTFAQLYRPEDLQAFLAGFTLEEWRAQLGDPAFAFHVAEAADGLAGFVKLGPLKLPVEPRGRALLLYQLYVLGQHRGTGIAQALMDCAFDEAQRRNVEELYLTVYIDNARAIRFYERFGFEPVGKYAFMVGQQADEDIIMRKRL